MKRYDFGDLCAAASTGACMGLTWNHRDASWVAIIASVGMGIVAALMLVAWLRVREWLQPRWMDFLIRRIDPDGAHAQAKRDRWKVGR